MTALQCKDVERIKRYETFSFILFYQVSLFYMGDMAHTKNRRRRNSKHKSIEHRANTYTNRNPHVKQNVCQYNW